ncbi:phytanoyl-CoA dioxygenase family protein [Cerasicoccus arenae]|uniref:Syringomycin biosynthesis enzyme n=1 Tax=Cerasicoccus arenae TaxID=424488 RepID=A0A8J3D9S2_9BACT|nr:phytanoyl-CoA dioxygenase family protein [Cerasicoccus arenae]MBK1856776.1 phytanoyl-CoA dioxygenase family protein [Cerasicoccus arenae]GHB99431.1 syringomycin biosynthesis enzyme [Cerasicoccus arenae]
MNTTSPPRLSAEEVSQYKAEGFVLPHGKIFSDEKFAALVEHFNSKLAKLSKDERPEAMDTPHFEDAKLNEWALAPEVVNLVEPLLGPDILLFSTHFICKPQGDGRRVPWHEDSAYWRKMMSPMEVATVWLALDPSTRANGCMYVIPKSHNTGKKGFSDYEGVDENVSVFSTEIIPSQRKDELAVPCELQPNHCSLHDARTQHGSPPNTSNQRRCGWTIRFIPAHVQLHPDFLDIHLLYQARGQNLLNQNLADPTVSYPQIMENRRASKFSVH